MLTDCMTCVYLDKCEQEDRWSSCINYKMMPTTNPPPQTNADRIRAMTDEELAEWGATLPCCPLGPDLEELCYPQNVCENTDFARKCWLNWLKQEVKDEQ